MATEQKKGGKTNRKYGRTYRRRPKCASKPRSKKAPWSEKTPSVPRSKDGVLMVRWMGPTEPRKGPMALGLV